MVARIKALRNIGCRELCKSLLESRLIRSALSLSVLALSVAGCSYNKLNDLRVSLSQWPGYEFINLGAEEKIISDIDVVPLTDQSAVARAYLRGELDVVQLRTMEVLGICSKLPEKCPVIVLVLNESTGGDQIMSINLNSISDLLGKKVAVAPNSFGPFVIHKAIKMHNLSMAEISLSPMLVSEMTQALSLGEVDAVVLYPPASEKVRDIGAKTLFDSSKLPGQILDVLAVEPVTFATRKKELSSIVSGWFKAHQFALENKVFSYSKMGSRLGLSAERFEQSLSGLNFFLDEQEQKELLDVSGVVENNIQDIHRTLIDLNLIKVSTPLPKISDNLIP